MREDIPIVAIGEIMSSPVFEQHSPLLCCFRSRNIDFKHVCVRASIVPNLFGQSKFATRLIDSLHSQISFSSFLSVLAKCLLTSNNCDKHDKWDLISEKKSGLENSFITTMLTNKKNCIPSNYENKTSFIILI